MSGLDQSIHVVQRENNPCRSFLFLNPAQGKYMPASPEKVLATFGALALLLEETSEATLVIGFAETATAIGAILAKALGDKVCYIHSTREDLENAPVLYFREEHSHAKNHQLSLKNKEMLQQARRVIFIDDEFTTGKTVLSFVAAMKDSGALHKDAEIHLMSYLNAMGSTDIFKNSGIAYHFAKTLSVAPPSIWAGEKVADVPAKISNIPYGVHHIAGYLDSRHGLEIGAYHRAVEALAKVLARCCEPKTKAETVLVLGTEECMYPALICAEYLQKAWGIAVANYATSRSPIVPRVGGDYPLFTRGNLPSFYENERKTYLYNLKKYDKVIVLTDAKAVEKASLDACRDLLFAYGNEDIDFVFWGNYEDEL